MRTKLINHMLNLVVIVALALGWLPVTSAKATSLSGAPAAQMLPVETLLNSDGTLNTRTGANGALDLRGWHVALDSTRGPILTRNARTSAAPDTDPWSVLAPDGLNGIVTTLAVMGNDLYVGGEFTQSADGTVTNLNHIARYRGGAWSAVAHNGLDLYVNALAVNESDLYVGGNFTQTADGMVTNLNNIAKFVSSSVYLYLPLVIRQ